MDLQKIKSGVDWRVRRAAQRLLAKFPHRPPPIILIYHRIAKETFDPWGGAVTPENFREHLIWLSRNRTLLPLRVFGYLHRRGVLPADAVAVTLDDGYACNSDIAAPLLTEFQVPATMFLPTELIIRGDPFWWDELEEIVLEHQGPSLVVEGEKVVLGEKSSADRNWHPWSTPSTPRQEAFLQIHVLLARKPPAKLRLSMTELRRQAQPLNDPPALKRPMSPEQVRKSASRLLEFGSHALNHPWLPNLDRAEQNREIGSSVEQCRALSGHRPTAFAYPFGMFDERSKQLVEEAGFECACTTRDLAVSKTSPRFALPRLQVGNWDAATLERAMTKARIA